MVRRCGSLGFGRGKQCLILCLELAFGVRCKGGELVLIGVLEDDVAYARNIIAVCERDFGNFGEVDFGVLDGHGCCG